MPAIVLKTHNHICPKCEPGPVPHAGGPVISTQSLISVDGLDVAVVGNKCLCVPVELEDEITEGSSLVSIEGKAIARVGDATAHGGKLVQGSDWITLD
jgi:uncharacterized Zn-binding protein involved in type VI secretion